MMLFQCKKKKIHNVLNGNDDPVLYEKHNECASGSDGASRSDGASVSDGASGSDGATGSEGASGSDGVLLNEKNDARNVFPFLNSRAMSV